MSAKNAPREKSNRRAKEKHKTQKTHFNRLKSRSANSKKKPMRPTNERTNSATNKSRQANSFSCQRALHSRKQLSHTLTQSVSQIDEQTDRQSAFRRCRRCAFGLLTGSGATRIPTEFDVCSSIGRLLFPFSFFLSFYFSLWLSMCHLNSSVSQSFSQTSATNELTLRTI